MRVFRSPFTGRAWREFQNLPFFHPPHWYVEREWARPPEAEYQQMLSNEGFIAPALWTQHNLVDYPIIERDLNDLEEHLMPVFWEFNQKAKHYQNQYYFYQWVFIIGAFATTFLAVLINFYLGFEREIVPLLIFDIRKIDAVRAFGILTALVGFLTSYFTLVSNQDKPRQRWANTRRLTEELRMTYFRFLSHLEPFDRADRVRRLRRRVLDIRRQELSNG